MSRLVVRSRAGAALAELALGPTGLQVARCTDPTLAAILRDLAGAEHLPAATRTPLAGGGHAVGVQRLTAADAGYAEALAGAIARKGPWRCEPA